MDMQPRSGDSPQVDLVVCAWGKQYLDRLFGYMIPSLLSCLRASRLHEKFECTFKLYIRPEDGEALEGASSLRALHELLKVEVRYASVESVMRLHAQASDEAYAKDAYILFLVPDCVYTTTLFESLVRAIEAEREALFVLGFRTVFEEISDELDRLKSENGDEIRLDARESVALALKYLHPDEKKWFWNVSESTNWLAHIYFRRTQETIHARCWHLRPLLARPRGRSPQQSMINLADYLAKVITDHQSVEVVTDSDFGFFFELSDEAFTALPTVHRPMSIRYCARWARHHTQAIHRLLFQQTVVVHLGDITEADREYDAGVVSAITSEILRIYDGERFYRKLLALQKALSVLRILDLLFGRFSLGLQRRFTALKYRIQGRLLDFVLRVLVQSGNQSSVDTRTATAIFDKGLRTFGRGELGEASQLIDTAFALSPNEERKFYSKLLHSLIELKRVAESAAARLLGQGSASGEEIVESAVAWLGGRAPVGSKRVAESTVSRPPGGRGPRSDRERVVFAVVVWGKDYVEPFLDYTLRTLLAPGNLPAVKDCELIFSIVTDKKSRPFFERHPVFADLKKLAHVEFFMFSPELTGLTGTSHYTKPTFNFYRMYGALDHISIHFARALHAHIFFVVADSLYSDGTVANILKYIRCGYYVCVNASLVARKEAILAMLEDKFPGYKPIALSGKDLADICFRYRHDYISQRLMIEPNTNFDRYPRELYFPVQGGLAVHALYQHPWAISADAISRNIAFDYHIVDFNLVTRIFASEPSLEKLKVIQDSSEAFIGNYAPQERMFHTTGQPFDVKRFVLEHMNSKPVHWHIWTHRQMIWCDTGLKPVANPQVVANEVLSSLRKVLMR